MRKRRPLEYEVLNLQEIAYRTGWQHGGRDIVNWAIGLLTKTGHHAAAQMLEGCYFGQATSGIQSSVGFQSSQHTSGNQAPENKAPDTSVQWPNQKAS